MGGTAIFKRELKSYFPIHLFSVAIFVAMEIRNEMVNLFFKDTEHLKNLKVMNKSMLSGLHL